MPVAKKIEFENAYNYDTDFENYLLVMNENNEIIFAIVPYLAMDAHKRAAELIEVTFGAKIKSFLGAGELKKVDGKYVLGNETSGYVNGLPKSINYNSIQVTEHILRDHLEDRVSPEFEGVPFSNRQVHLNPKLNRVVTEQKETLRNIRHDANNDLNILVMSIEIGAYEMITENTSSLEMFLDLFGTEEFTPRRIRVLQRWLTRIRSGETLSHREYAALKTYLLAINHGLSDPPITVLKLQP